MPLPHTHTHTLFVSCDKAATTTKANNHKNGLQSCLLSSCSIQLVVCVSMLLQSNQNFVIHRAKIQYTCALLPKWGRALDEKHVVFVVVKTFLIPTCVAGKHCQQAASARRCQLACHLHFAAPVEQLSDACQQNIFLLAVNFCFCAARKCPLTLQQLQLQLK